MKMSVKRALLPLMVAPTMVYTSAFAGEGPSPHRGAILIPDSTVEYPEDLGIRAHTNHLIHLRQQGAPAPAPATVPAGESPASISSVYGLVYPNGGSGTIVIVDAYDYPTAENDLNVFSAQFGLRACTTANGCFTKVYASGGKPRTNCGWAQEAALDIEWAHAMAPNANIVLVEAASNSFTNLFKAVDVGTKYIQGHNTTRGELSMSWGGSEFSSEASYDFHFPTKSNVVYFAASGDTGGMNIYPSVSPNVVSAGGTTINRDSNGNFLRETAWSGSGGGPSKYESRPPYQNSISTIVGNQRGAPDFSFDANPASGVSVYDSTPCNGVSGWLVFGGTSVAAPSLAGIVNAVESFAQDSASELTTIYSNMTNSSDFRDITSGAAGGFSAAPGWDFVTGVGSDQGVSGK